MAQGDRFDECSNDHIGAGAFDVDIKHLDGPRGLRQRSGVCRADDVTRADRDPTGRRSARRRRGGCRTILSTNESIGTDGIISNWRYLGPDEGHPEIVLVARDGLTIGSSRSEVLAAYPDVTDFGDLIDVNEGSGGFRFWLDGEQISQFGVVDCAD